MAIPGKDNGFDVEGLAAVDGRLLLGLRGPVLRGWSCLLEVRVAEHKGELRLQPLDDSGLLYRKHFLPLAGLGRARLVPGWRRPDAAGRADHGAGRCGARVPLAGRPQLAGRCGGR